MIKLLDEKNLATKFRILVEIASVQPDIRKKYIADRLGITIQSVSLYIKEMEQDGWLISGEESGMSITRKGTNWLKTALYEINHYLKRIEKVTRNMPVSAAVADCNLKKKQMVNLVMDRGVLVAREYEGGQAIGIVVSDAREGDDVGISSIEGIIELEDKSVKILSIPTIQRGGSKNTDLDQLKKELSSTTVTCAIGVEAVAALNRAGIRDLYTYGVSSVATEANRRGLDVTVVCVSNEITNFVNALEKNEVTYVITDLERKIPVR